MANYKVLLVEQNLIEEAFPGWLILSSTTYYRNDATKLYAKKMQRKQWIYKTKGKDKVAHVYGWY